MSDNSIKKNQDSDDMLPEYDFSRGTRGKYAQRFAEGTNLVMLEPDLARRFKSARDVNQALREHLKSQADPQ